MCVEFRINVKQVVSAVDPAGSFELAEADTAVNDQPSTNSHEQALVLVWTVVIWSCKASFPASGGGRRQDYGPKKPTRKYVFLCHRP